MLLLQYLMHALSAFLIGNSDEVDACGKRSHIDMEFVVLALHAKYLLPEHVDHLSLPQVLACDGDKAIGGVGMDGGESGGSFFFNTFI